MSNYAFAGYVDGNLDNTRNYNLAGSSGPPHTLPGPGDNVLLSDDGGIEFEPNFVEYGTLSVNAINYEDGVVVSGEDFVFSGAQTEITANTAYNCELESGATMNVANTANSISVGTGATLNVSNSGLVVSCTASDGTIDATGANVQNVGLSSGGVVNAGVVQVALMDGGGTLNATSLTNSTTEGGDALLITADSGSNSVTVANIINIDTTDSKATVPSGAIGLVTIGENLDGIAPGFSASVTAQSIYSAAGSTVGMSNSVSGAEASLTVANYDSNGSTPAGLTNFLGIGNGATVTVQNTIGIGRQAGDNSTVAIGGSGSTLTYDGSAPLIIGDAGTGTVTVADGATLDSSDSAVLIGVQEGSTGSVTVNGSGSTLQAEKLTVGGAIPDPSNPDAGQDGDWTYTGGVGTLTVLDDASVTVDDTLKLQGVVTVADDGTETAEGGIDIGSGGSIEVGGGGGVAPENTLEIADAGSLVGHGLINSDVTGEVTVSDTTTTPTYSLNIDNNGTIEAQDGILALNGNLSGDGQVLVGQDSTLVFGGSVADDEAVMFLPDGDPDVIINVPETNEANAQNAFNAALHFDQFDPSLDKIQLGTVSYDNQGRASYLFETGQNSNNYVLQVLEGGNAYYVSISKPSDPSQGWEGSFLLADNGKSGTQITVGNLPPGLGGPINSYLLNRNTNYSLTTPNPAGQTPYLGVVRIGNEEDNGSGIIIGLHYILTAAHVATDKNDNPISNVDVYVGGIKYSGKVVQKGNYNSNEGQGATTRGILKNEANDWAVIYVTQQLPASAVFGDTLGSFSGGTVNLTGYSGLLPEGATGSPQYNAIGQVNSDGIFFDFAHGLGGIGVGGNSGGPIWTYNGGKSANAVGMVVTEKYALKISAIPSLPSDPITFYSSSNAAIITAGIVLLSGDADTGQSVQFVLNTSENVVVTGGGPTLSLNDGGTATYDMAASTGTQLVFDYTVGAGDQTSNLEITQVNSTQSVQAPGGASINFALLDNLPTNLSINSPLVVTSVASSRTGEVSSGQLVQLTLAINGAVTVDTAGGAPILLLNDGATATYDAVASNPSAGTLVFDYTVGSGDETANLEVTSVNLPSGTMVENAAGYNADFSAALNSPVGLQVGPAYVTAITPSQSSELTTGQTVQLVLAMSQGVTLDTTGGSPTLSLSDGATAIYDAAASNPSAGKLVFDYTVELSDYNTDLQVLSYDPNGATAKDAHGVNADLSGATQDDLALDVNAAIFTNLTVSPETGEADSGQLVTLTLTMSEAVTVNLTGGSPTLSLNDGAIATYDSTASDPTAGTLVFDYTVGATDEVGSLQISQVNLNGAIINDANGNAADLSAAANFTTTLQVGRAFVTALTPSLTEEIYTGQIDQLALTMSQAVTVNTTGGSPTLSLSDGATATYDATASSPANGTLVFDYTVGANDYSSDLQVLGYNPNGSAVTDANGVTADFSSVADDDLALDVNAASVTNVTSSPSSGEADSGAQVTVTLTMSEAVVVTTTRGSPTVSLSTGATATYDSAASNPANGTLVFDYTVGATDETPDLEVIQVNLDGASINDANGNAADLSAVSNFDTGLQVGPVFVDSLSASQSGDITTGQTVQLTLAMSGDLKVTTTNGSPTLSLSDGVVATYNAAASSPSTGSLVFSYTVGTHDYASALTVTGFNPNGSTVTDANGVTPDFSSVTQFDPGLDVNAAYVTNVTTSTGEADTGQLVKLTVTMNEVVTVTTTGGSPTLSLSDGATATYDSASSHPSSGTLVFDYTVGATDEDPSLQIAQVNLNGATINDADDNPADFSAAPNFTTGLQVGPVFVNALTPSVTGELAVGQSVQLTLAMSGGLTLNGSGLPSLTLNNGATATYDKFYSAPSSGTFVYDYTVGANQDTANLGVASVNFPSPPTDGNGTAANFADALNISLGLSIGEPAISAITENPNTGALNVGGSGTLALTINEDVTVTGAPTLTLNDGGTATYDAAKSTATSLVFDYTVTSSNTDVSSLSATALTIPVGASVEDGNGNSLSTSLAGLTQTGPQISITTSPPPLNPAPPASTTAVMVMSNRSNGDYEIYDVGGNAILAAYSLGQVGSPWTFVGLGTLQAGDTSDMLLRNTSTGGFEAYYISNNNITNAALIGTVGTDWNFAGTGDFDGQSSLSELLLRNSASGSFELYQVAGGGVLSGSAVAAVGNNLQVSGFGNFSGSSTTQMIMEQANEAPGTNAYWLYTYNPSSAAFAGHVGGTVGNNLSVVGFGDLLGNGETQMVMQQNNGDFWLYTYQPSTNSLSGTLVGAIGSNFHVVGFGPLGTSGQDEMLMQDAAGDFEVYQYNATLNAFVGSSMGAVGAPWVVDGIAANPPGGSGAAGSASTAQLVQAMASMGAGAPLSTATGATVGANLPQPTLLTTPHTT